MKLCAHVRVDLGRRRPRNLAALKLSLHQTGPRNKISPRRDFEEIRYIVLCLFLEFLLVTLSVGFGTANKDNLLTFHCYYAMYATIHSAIYASP